MSIGNTKNITTSVIIMSSTETLVEFSDPDIGMTNKNKRRFKRDIEARLLLILDETDGWITNKNPAKLSPTDWKQTPCKMGIISKSYSNHVNRCRACEQAVGNKPVNQAAARVMGGFVEPPAQKEISQKAMTANDFNKTQPVTVTKTQERVSTITRERGEDFIRLAPVAEKKISIVQSVDALETLLVECISKLDIKTEQLETKAKEQLATKIDALRKWAETIVELPEIDAEFAELECRKAKLLDNIS